MGLIERRVRPWDDLPEYQRAVPGWGRSENRDLPNTETCAEIDGPPPREARPQRAFIAKCASWMARPASDREMARRARGCSPTGDSAGARKTSRPSWLPRRAKAQKGRNEVNLHPRADVVWVELPPPRGSAPGGGSAVIGDRMPNRTRS